MVKSYGMCVNQIFSSMAKSLSVRLNDWSACRLEQRRRVPASSTVVRSMSEHRKKWQRWHAANRSVSSMPPFREVRVCSPPSTFVRSSPSTGITGAQKGTLTFMVGGEADDFQTVQPILAQMGKSIVHAGSNGSGLSAKICNNLLLAVRWAMTISS